MTAGPGGTTVGEDPDDTAEPDDTLADEEQDGGHTDKGKAAEGAPAGPAERGAAADPAARGRHRLQQSERSHSVPSGEALTPQEATAVLGAHGAEVVVVVGEVDAGKTTLLAAVYERLAAGPVAGWAFAASESLLGFEARAHFASAASGLSEPDTPRTSRSTERVALHLAVRHANGQQRHLLLSDVSGEHAKGLLKYNQPGDYAPLLRSATHVLLLIDGARLVTTRGQNVALADARTLLRAVAEGPDLRPATPLDIVVTKWDRCGGADGLDDELDDLLAWAAGIWQPVTLRRTAARPSGEGLDELFAALLVPAPARPVPVPLLPQSRRRLHGFVANDGVPAKFLAAAGAVQR
ncbi:TRAFAC clade GTPase domain-containing protein [Blastococcus tunisiensis]|uniref:Double-GTPase 2 domain-containing protein n=1 Tax=Blastococcus tunisiensis TaxID=1798228 RepID=A0A1I1VYN9_9ACTN|nr:hypothetical protein [Blastococcus sp. DSM 46838]SFD88011.1 hypothetical protein SAMN05216574_101161 [Blastococcus sp. DSM 46838]